MSTRDELEAALISGFAIKNAVWVENDMPCLRLGEVADYLLSQGWRPPMRTINTVEELEALPEGTMIVTALDEYEEVHQFIAKDDPGWPRLWQGRNVERFSKNLVKLYDAPFRVVWEPEEKE